jgi:hypothetical protein
MIMLRDLAPWIFFGLLGAFTFAFVALCLFIYFFLTYEDRKRDRHDRA